MSGYVASVRNINPDSVNAGLDFSDIFACGAYNGVVNSFSAFFARATTQDLNVGDLNIVVNGKSYNVQVDKSFPVGVDREVYIGVSVVYFTTQNRQVEFRIDDSRYPGLVISDNMRSPNRFSIDLDTNLFPRPSSFNYDQNNLLKDINLIGVGANKSGWKCSTTIEKTSSDKKDFINNNDASTSVTIPGGTYNTAGRYTVKFRYLYTAYWIPDYTGYLTTGVLSKSIDMIYTSPTITYMEVEHSNINNPTIVKWNGTDFNKFKIQITRNGAPVYNIEGGQVNSFSIPVGVLNSEESVVISLTLGWNNTFGSPTTKNLSPKLVYATITNLDNIGQFWELPITFNWRSENQSGYEYELFQNNVSIKTGNGASAKEFQIPGNTYKSKDNATVRVRTYYNNISNIKGYSSWAEKSLSLKDIEATISSLLVTGEYWESPISFSWLSENQEQFKIEALKDNIVKKTYTGTTSKSYTIPAEQLDEGQYTFKVSVGYQNRFVNSQSKTITLKTIQPTVKNIVLSGSNIDLNIEVGWQSENQQKYELRVLKDNVEKISYNGLTEKKYIINGGALTDIGLYVFKIRTGYKDRWSEWVTIDQVLSETLPSIGIFEPDGRIEDKDKPIRVYWTSTNQSRWELDVNGNIYNGTTEKEQILTAGLLQTGKATMKLTIYLDIAGREKKVVKTVEFIVKGRPPAPTIISGEAYDNNRPTFTWDTSDQVAYQLQIFNLSGDMVYDSEWVNGLIVSDRVRTYLDDGDYTVMVRVKNIYAETSDWSSKQFNITTVKPGNVNLKVYDRGKFNELKWITDRYSSYYIFRNNDMIAQTFDNNYIDNSCQGENIYYVKAITNDDISMDSNMVKVVTDLEFPILSIDGNMLELIYKTGLEDIAINYNNMPNKIFYSGRRNPVTNYGEFEDITYSINYSELNNDNYFKLLDMISKKAPLLYRSNRYKMYLTFDSNELTDNVNEMVYSLDAYKTDVIEVIEYD